MEKTEKELENEKRRLRYQKNKEKILAQNKLWRDNNKDKITPRPDLYKKYKETYKKYAHNHKEEKEKYRKDWYEENKKTKLAKDKIYREENAEKIAEYRKEYRIKNKETLRINKRNYEKKKRNTDPLYKLKSNTRRFISNAIKKRNYTKKSRTHEILGCSFEDFKSHIESLWEPWMTWENYGLYNGQSDYGWDIDHIIPQSSAETEEDVIKLNHHTNLRPLCSYHNRVIKWNRILEEKHL